LRRAENPQRRKRVCIRNLRGKIETAVPDKPFEEHFEEESSRLAESLKSCRSVVNDYRVILTRNHAFPSPDESENPDARQ
jgi:hypothetical protein